MSNVDTLHFWCHKILPLVYDDSLSYYELLCKVVAKMNELIVSNNDLSDVIKKEVTEQVKEAIDSGALEEALDDALKEIKNTVSGEETARKNADTTLEDNIDKEVSARKSADNALSQRVYNHSLKGKKVLLIGDSMAYGTGNIINGEPRGWTYYFEKICGCDATIIGMRRAGFLRTCNTSDYIGLNFDGGLTKIAESLTEDERNEYTLIVAAGGYNDNYSAIAGEGLTISDLNSAVHKFCEDAREYFPNANIYVMPLFVAKRLTLDYWQSFMWVIRGAEERGVATSYDSMFWMNGRTDWVNDDEIHPNDIGYLWLGRMLHSYVTGGTPTFTTSANITTQFTNGFRPMFCYTDGMKSGVKGTLKCTNQWIDTTVSSGTTLFTVPTDYGISYAVYAPCFIQYAKTETENRPYFSTAWVGITSDRVCKIVRIVGEDAGVRIYNPEIVIDIEWIRGM